MKTHYILLALTLVMPAYASSSFQRFGPPTGVYSSGVKTAPALPLYFSSGVGADKKDGGTMKAQALGVLKRLEANINAAGLGLGEVVFARAYLAPGANGTVDYAGWEEAWKQVFNNEKNRPARTTIAVPVLGEPGRFIEVEYVCVPKEAAKMAAGSAALSLPVTNPNLKPYGTKEGRIYAGMGIMPGSGMYWTAGITAPVLKADAPPTSYENRGNMLTQARNTLATLKTNLAGVGLTLADVVYVRAFLGPDGNMDGKFDYEAWNKAYGEFFNTSEQPHKPARTTVTTPTFGNPSTLIEIEFIAAFPKAPSLFEGGPHPALRAYGAPTAAISSGVAVKPGTTLYFSAGALPGTGGNVKTQALSTLESLKSRLAEAGIGFKDVVFLRAYVVPGAGGSVDREGWTEAYTTFFNNPGQPHKPARTTIPVHSLPNPDSKIEIDVIAVAP